MKKKHSYGLDHYRDPKGEAKRLEKRALARIDELVPQLVAAGLRHGMRLLDLGSGTGTRSLHLARYLKSGFVTGLDTSDELILRAKKAQARSKLKNVEFLKFDFSAQAIPPGQFDFAYIRLVVQHLPDPVQVLRNVRQSLKPGGVLFIEDTDRDLMTIYPEVAGWRETYEKVIQAQTRLGGDPRSGRKLGSYLVEAGFKSVQTNLIPVSGSGQVFEDWLANNAVTLLNNLNATDARAGHLVLRKLARLQARQPVFIHQVWFQAFGRTPLSPQLTPV
jgi:ubiquinone/menaquinone biosynthesis C-methylase UbiE